jgi:hypothetical protein
MNSRASARSFVFPAVLLVFLFQGCTSSGRPAGPSGGAAASSPAAQGTAFVRTCESSVYGNLGHEWNDGEVTLGPVTFVGLHGLASAPIRQLKPEDGRDPRLKVLAVVRPGPPVTVRVSPAEHAALIYNPGAFNARDVSEGDSAVTFEPCKPGQSPFGAQAADRPTQFNGGLIVDGPMCVHIDLSVSGAAKSSQAVPLGRGQSCA